MLGEIVEVASSGRRDDDLPDGEFDHVVTVARTADGALGTIETSRISGYGFDCRTELIGSAGTARIERPCADAVERRGPGSRGTRSRAISMRRFAAAYTTQLEQFADVARGDAAPPVTAEDGVAAVRAALAAERSLRTGGATVALSEMPSTATVEALR